MRHESHTQRVGTAERTTAQCGAWPAKMPSPIIVRENASWKFDAKSAPLERPEMEMRETFIDDRRRKGCTLFHARAEKALVQRIERTMQANVLAVILNCKHEKI